MLARMTRVDLPHIRRPLTHEDVKETIESLVFFLDRHDLAPPAEDCSEVALDEEAVVMITMDIPVAAPLLARVVLEFGAEDR